CVADHDQLRRRIEFARELCAESRMVESSKDIARDEDARLGEREHLPKIALAEDGRDRAEDGAEAAARDDECDRLAPVRKLVRDHVTRRDAQPCERCGETTCVFVQLRVRPSPAPVDDCDGIGTLGSPVLAELVQALVAPIALRSVLARLRGSELGQQFLPVPCGPRARSHDGRNPRSACPSTRYTWASTARPSAPSPSSRRPTTRG